MLTVILLIWSATIPTTQPGGTVTLEPGVYQPAYVTTPCTIRSRVPGAAVIDGAPDRHGIEVRAYSVTIDGLRVVGAGLDGIKTYGAFTTVKNCVISHSGGQGVSGHGVIGLSVTGCTITRCGTQQRYDHGVYADGLFGEVRGNTIVGSASYGICLYPSASSWTVENNVIDGAGPDCSGILFQGSGRVSGNVITNTPWGVDFRGAGPWVDGGNVTTRPARLDFCKGTVTTQESR